MRFVSVLLATSMLFTFCSPNNLTEDNSLKAYFDENNLTGCFGLFDNGQGKFTIYNLERYRDSAYLPASTFKIINSLIALETGVAPHDSMVINWDGVTRRFESWNQDLSMRQAFTFSAVPWYQELARRIGKDTMQRWLDTLGYGSQASITTAIDTFWLDNSVRITADENLGVVKKLYFDQLPFQKRTQRIVRQMMLREQNANFKLAYKTGWAHTEKGHSLGWIVGWVEENLRPYFFVLQVESPDPDYDMTEVRMKMLKQILSQYGFFQGKK